MPSNIQAPSVPQLVSALRGSPGPVIMAASQAADYLFALHHAAKVAEQYLAAGLPGEAAAAIKLTLDSVGR